MKRYAVLSLDSTDDFGEQMEGEHCLVVELQTSSLVEARKYYNDGNNKSNNYLVEVIEQEEYI